MNEQQYPTREQLAETLRGVYDEAAAVDYHARRVPFDIDYTAADAVLALFPQPTPSAETCRVTHDAHGVTLECFLSQGHEGEHFGRFRGGRGTGRWNDVPPSIADMAPGTTFAEVSTWTVHRDACVGLYARRATGQAAERPLYAFDPSTIRDVTPPESSNDN